ncbi:cupin domain-containing protein [Maribacter sp. MAR_2009_72]|uniref:cupin domain-containing protein n=1 Tax=Maribacter sp. MAR_2009_72 TaxID=1250050 RepID=UPI001199AC8F|nr:cupin domain-containing protein [Maribacter sp. MAR_2009_72]TVZ16510.1 mannose-6-phosphate isomerase-like protein (cupin superfamily) [Maribacter sp. MAR_2009_72]
MKKINLNDKFEHVDSFWHPHQIGIVDDMHVLLAKVKGEFVWHAHEYEDELFHVQKGTLYMQFRDRTEVVEEGEVIIVPKGTEHCPMTKNGEIVHVLLFEKLSTQHTGATIHEISKTNYPKI